MALRQPVTMMSRQDREFAAMTEIMIIAVMTEVRAMVVPRRGRHYRWAFYRLTGVARAYPFVWYLAPLIGSVRNRPSGALPTVQCDRPAYSRIAARPRSRRPRVRQNPPSPSRR